MIKTIKKHFNYIFYGILAIHIVVLIKLILLNTSFKTYMSVEGEYLSILDKSNTILMIALTFKYFLPQIGVIKFNFFEILKKNRIFIGVSIIFFTILIMDNTLESRILIELQQAHNNIIPIHLLLYVFACYFIYSDYSSIYSLYIALNKKSKVSYLKMHSKLILATQKSFIHFSIICLGVFLTGKTELALYVINHINNAFILLTITTFIFFIALYLLHRVKKYKR